MIDINEYVRLVNSVSLTQNSKNRIADYLIQKTSSKRDFPKKQVAAAAVIVAVGVCIPIVRRSGIITRY